MFSSNHWECEVYAEERIKAYVEQAEADRRFQKSRLSHRSGLSRLWQKYFSRPAIKRGQSETEHDVI